jgi:ERF superfamily
MKKQGIYGAIIKVMQEVEPIAKGRTNTQQNYKFRGVDELMNAISPMLSKHGVFPTVQQVVDVSSEGVTSKSGGQGWRLVRRYTFRFYAEDGSFVDTTADGEAIDYGDKASNKAQSVAYREAMFKMFVIPFQGEDIENDSHELVKPEHKPAAAKPVPPKQIADKQLVQKDRIKKLCDKINKAMMDGGDPEAFPLETKEEYEGFVKALTGLTLEASNLGEILTRLEAQQ